MHNRKTLLTDKNDREIMFTLAVLPLTGGTGRVDEKTLGATLDRAAPGERSDWPDQAELLRIIKTQAQPACLHLS